MKQINVAQIWIVLIGLIAASDSRYVYGMDLSPEQRFERIQSFLTNPINPDLVSKQITTFLKDLEAVQKKAAEPQSSLRTQFTDFIPSLGIAYVKIFEQDKQTVTGVQRKMRL